MEMISETNVSYACKVDTTDDDSDIFLQIMGSVRGGNLVLLKHLLSSVSVSPRYEDDKCTSNERSFNYPSIKFSYCAKLINGFDDEGFTPLMRACLLDDPSSIEQKHEMVIELLAHGADLLLKKRPCTSRIARGYDGATAFALLQTYRSARHPKGIPFCKKTVSVLLDHGEAIDEPHFESRRTYLMTIVDAPTVYPYLHTFRDGYMHYSRRLTPAEVREREAEIDAKAAEAVAFLTARGADPNLLWTQVAPPPSVVGEKEACIVQRRSVLQMAAAKGRTAVVRALLASRPCGGLNIDHVCGQGLTALDLALISGSEGCVRVLLAHGADAKGGKGLREAPLMFASGFSSKFTVSTPVEDSDNSFVNPPQQRGGGEDTLNFPQRRASALQSSKPPCRSEIAGDTDSPLKFPLLLNNGFDFSEMSLFFRREFLEAICARPSSAALETALEEGLIRAEEDIVNEEEVIATLLRDTTCTRARTAHQKICGSSVREPLLMVALRPLLGGTVTNPRPPSIDIIRILKRLGASSYLANDRGENAVIRFEKCCERDRNVLNAEQTNALKECLYS